MEKKIIIKQADVLEALKDYPDNYFDGLLSDPPYGLGKIKNPIDFIQEWIQEGTGKVNDKDFMGKDWELPPPMIWKEVYRVLKPGAYLLVYAGPRVMDLMGLSLRLAGFEIRDCLMWLYGQGFPKSMDISKALDKMAGAKREVIGTKIGQPGYSSKIESVKSISLSGGKDGSLNNSIDKTIVTAPATDKAKLWDGYGTALKPAYENIFLAMKPLSEKTYAENVTEWGTGGLNIDESRIGSESINTHNRGNNMAFPKRPNEKTVEESGRNVPQNNISSDFHKGRFPANLLLTHHPDCVMIGIKEVKGSGTSTKEHEGYGGESVTSMIRGKSSPSNQHDPGGKAIVEDWNCHPDCPIGQLNESVGVKKSGDNCVRTKQGDGYHGNIGKAGDVQTAYGDSGFVSRFFYNGKVSRKERELGLDALSKKTITDKYEGMSTRCKICGNSFLNGAVGTNGGPCTCDETIYGSKAERAINPEFHNNHPTLKPIALNQYLANLIRPPYGDEPLRLLNCFSGVCSEAIGAFFAGWQEIVCIEREKDYTNIGQARVEYWTKFASYDTGMNVGSIPVRKKKGEMPTLF